MLAYEITGDGPPLLIAHGLFGSGRNWGVIAKRMAARGRRVVTVDMRNHGASPWNHSQNYHDMADDLAEVIEVFGPMDVLGHSMGGKAAMVLAVTRPGLVKSLIVGDIAPTGYGHTQVHLIHAMRAADLGVARRSEVVLPGVEDAGVRAFLLQSLDLQEKKWRLNLDTLEDQMDLIIGFPELSGAYDGPTLMLSGAESDYVLPEHRAEIKRLFPKARFAKIPGAGHWLHAEKPREFEAAVAAFLNA